MKNWWLPRKILKRRNTLKNKSRIYAMPKLAPRKKQTHLTSYHHHHPETNPQKISYSSEIVKRKYEPLLTIMYIRRKNSFSNHYYYSNTLLLTNSNSSWTIFSSTIKTLLWMKWTKHSLTKKQNNYIHPALITIVDNFFRSNFKKEQERKLLRTNVGMLV